VTEPHVSRPAPPGAGRQLEMAPPGAGWQLEVRGLAKRFGTVITAQDVSFGVAPGEALGIVGPNGAGKSTLLDMISGGQRPDGGTVHFDGRDITRLGAADRCRAGIGRTYQVPRPFGGMTVFENVFVAATFGGGSHGQAGYDTARDALERAGLLARANERAGALRLLDRKRLELARALATRPNVLLLDEIAGGLTDREVPALVQTIRGLRDTGVTVVWIEHIVHALVAVVDRLMCLAAGKVLAIGEPQAVLRSRAVIDVYLGSTFDVTPTVTT
jgi:branched-chain amino acid transport system ATP-binding protein